MDQQNTRNRDVVVVGGGLFGSAVAFGLARRGMSVALLDGSDDAVRAARGNFGLVWVQSKGLGFQRYQEWSRESASLWTDFAAELSDLTGIDPVYRGGGGLHLLLGEEELTARRWQIQQMQQQAGPGTFECEIIDRKDVAAMLPDLELGPEVVGASYSRHDGDSNPLRLLRALHAGVIAAGSEYCPDAYVRDIAFAGGTFTATTDAGPFSAPKIVLACGHGIPELAAKVGLDAPIRPQRGQVLVTERVRARLPMAVSMVRQTDEGGFQLGNSAEDVGFDTGTTLETSHSIAHRAVRAFPQLASVRLVRTWGCLRVLTPDNFAIYEESERCPGAYVATSHSGVTLAAINARHVAGWIAEGTAQPGFEQFSARRFHVAAAE